MPWYWSDDLARVLITDGRIRAEDTGTWLASPVALRSDAETLEEAAQTLVEDGEIPLAA